MVKALKDPLLLKEKAKGLRLLKAGKAPLVLQRTPKARGRKKAAPRP